MATRFFNGSESKVVEEPHCHCGNLAGASPVRPATFMKLIIFIIMTCKHHRHKIPTEESDFLRVSDLNPCEVCDFKDRCIYCDHRKIYVFIPKFIKDVKQKN